MGKPTMNKAYLWVELSTFYNTLIDATYQNMKANVNVIILKHEIPGMRQNYEIPGMRWNEVECECDYIKT